MNYTVKFTTDHLDGTYESVVSSDSTDLIDIVEEIECAIADEVEGVLEAQYAEGEAEAPFVDDTDIDIVSIIPEFQIVLNHQPSA